MPAGMLFKFDGSLGELNEEVFAYEDRLIIRNKGFASTKSGESLTALLFKDIASVSLDKTVIGKKSHD